jgi:WD40 repeat protein
MHPLPFSGHRGPIYALVNVAAGGSFYSGSGDGLVVKWDIARPDEGSSLVDVGQAIFALTVVPGKGLLIVGAECGDLHVVDVQGAREVQLLKAHSKGLYRILLLSDDRLVCAGGDGSMSIWSIEGHVLSLIRQIPLSESKLRDLALSPNGEHLAVACGDGTIRILDTVLFNELYTLRPTTSNDLTSGEALDGTLVGISAVAFHPTKAVLISGGKDGVVRTWQSSDRYRELLHFPAHKGTVYTIAFNAEGTRCATASRDKSAKLWDAADFAPMSRLDRVAGGHTHSVNTVLWCGSTLLTGSDDRRILGWPDA